MCWVRGLWDQKPECVLFFFQAEDGIRDAQESRGLGDVYKRQLQHRGHILMGAGHSIAVQNFNENLSILIMTGLYLSLIHI